MKKILASLIFVFTFFTLSITNVSAKVIANENGLVSIPKNEIVNDDLFIGAQSVDLEGTVNGDLFIGAETVRIKGIINGNLHVGANSLNLEGVVKGNVYAGAQNVLVTGSKIGGSLLAGAATINVDKDSVVGGAVIVGAGLATIDSSVKRSLYAGTENLVIGENAKIMGQVYKPQIDTVKNNGSFEDVRNGILKMMAGVKVFATLVSFAGALLIGFLYFKFLPKHFMETSDLVSKSFWKSLGVGFLVTISFIPGLVVLFITVVGIPLAFLSILFFVLYAYLSKIVVGLSLGSILSRKLNLKMGEFAVFALGLLAVYAFKLIPFVAPLACMVIFFAGLGALTLQMFSKTQK